jgi:hypothetical protein
MAARQSRCTSGTDSTALASARAIYGASFNPQVTLKALCYFDDGNVGTLSAETKARLLRAASVDLDALPVIARED